MQKFGKTWAPLCSHWKMKLFPGDSIKRALYEVGERPLCASGYHQSKFGSYLGESLCIFFRHLYSYYKFSLWTSVLAHNFLRSGFSLSVSKLLEFLQGNGRGFCAGGDVAQVYHLGKAGKYGGLDSNIGCTQSLINSSNIICSDWFQKGEAFLVLYLGFRVTWVNLRHFLALYNFHLTNFIGVDLSSTQHTHVIVDSVSRKEGWGIWVLQTGVSVELLAWYLQETPRKLCYCILMSYSAYTHPKTHRLSVRNLTSIAPSVHVLSCEEKRYCFVNLLWFWWDIFVDSQMTLNLFMLASAHDSSR